MTNKLNEFLHYRALAAKLETQHTLGRVIDNAEAEQLPGKQVCTTLSHPLVERLESVLDVLEMSKRQFIELAILSALDEAEHILECHEVFGSKGNE